MISKTYFIGDFTGFNSELRFSKRQQPGYYGSVTRKGNLNSFGISRLTTNHQYKIKLRSKLTQTFNFF